MEKDFIDYGQLIDDAMHYVVRRVLERVRDQGELPGDHHFFITFLTRHPGVMMSETLLRQYPEEMTIVLQHQFWDLEIEQDRFTVVLSFNNVKENLTIPFSALVSFADPSVKFGLQFNQLVVEDEEYFEDDEGMFDSEMLPKQSQKPITDGSNVVTLDSFRKD